MTAMHPTMTEHDWRFPRRPAHAAAAAASAAAGTRDAGRFDHRDAYTHAARSRPAMASAARPAAGTAAAPGPRTMTTGPGGPRSGLQDFRLDLSLTHGAVHPDLLRPAAFPSFEQSAARENQRLEEMQRQDPLATQIWRFYTKTKQLLPAQERMENLTWRLMHLELQKRRAANAAKYGYVLVWFLESWRERCAVLTLGANQEIAVCQQRRMHPVVLRNCVSRPSMPRCHRRTQ
jgi:GATA-binding protein